MCWFHKLEERTTLERDFAFCASVFGKHLSFGSNLYPTVTCIDPSCGGHGWCVKGECICSAGWRGANCSEVDRKVFTCLPSCAGNGHYDIQKSACVCNEFWDGPDCSEGKSFLEFFLHCIFETAVICGFAFDLQLKLSSHQRGASFFLVF